jgi:chromosome segregation ATPase
MFKENAEELKRRVTELEHCQKSNESEQISTNNHRDDFARLQAKNDALEKKLRKYISYYESLTKEKQAIYEILNDDIQSCDSKDICVVVSALCDRLRKLEEECVTYSTVKNSLEDALEETKKKLDDAELQKIELDKTLKKAKEEVSSLSLKQKQFQQIAQNVKCSAKDLEDEKNRQVSYLEKENLQILEENRKLKQELRSLKSRSKSSVSTFQEDPTEDLGSILSNFAAHDKENHHNGIKESATAVTKFGLGSGEGELNDDNTQECQQS